MLGGRERLYSSSGGQGNRTAIHNHKTMKHIFGHGIMEGFYSPFYYYRHLFFGEGSESLLSL